jgi:hypothetical protein
MCRLCLLLLSFCLATLAQAESRVFVSLAGTLLEAEIVSVAGDNISLKRISDGQTLVVNRKTLCKEDNSYIANWQVDHPDQVSATASPPAGTASASTPKFSLACDVQTSKSNRGPPDGGQRTIEIGYTFNLNNREVQRDLAGAKCLVVTLARDAAGRDGDLIVLQKVEFDVAIRSQAKSVHTTERVLLSYTQGPSERVGVLNHGYIVFILDAAGNVLLSRSNPVGNTKYLAEIQAIKEVPCVIDRDFKVRPDTSVPLGNIQF